MKQKDTGGKTPTKMALQPTKANRDYSAMKKSKADQDALKKAIAAERKRQSKGRIIPKSL